MTAPVTVVIPTLGRRASVVRCIEAVRAGRAQPAEIVLVDQSDDPTLAPACVDAAAPVPVVVLRTAPAGLAAARNAALAAATQPLAAITDDDCVPGAGWIEAAVAALDGDDALVAVCGPVLPLPDPTGELVPVSSRTSSTTTTYAESSEPWHIGSGGNLVVRAAALRALGGYDERLGAGSAGGAGEDIDVLHRLLRLGTIRYDADAIVQHEQKPPGSRRETRARYGRGVGAAIGIWLRAGDRSALRVLLRWLLLRVRLLGADRGELRVLAGTFGGLVHGLRSRR